MEAVRAAVASVAERKGHGMAGVHCGARGGAHQSARGTRRERHVTNQWARPSAGSRRKDKKLSQSTQSFILEEGGTRMCQPAVVSSNGSTTLSGRRLND